MTTIELRNCQFSYRCQASWTELLQTSEEKVRFCTGCGKTVHRCDTDAELLKAIPMDLCVAIPQAESAWDEDLRFLVGSPRQSD